MKITFLGAAKTVTGSCHYVETTDCRFLVDCGMFQGQVDELNNEPFPFNPAELDFILLTHAHIDHSGRIPKIYNDGFKNNIYCTKATTELCGIMLPDSGHIQEFENEWTNRKRQRAGEELLQPLYTSQDAIDCLKLFKSINYSQTVNLNENIKVRFNDAGHILGSAIIELWIKENGKETKVVFSGDLGNKNMPILRDPSVIKSADCLVIESTYGNRLHENNNKVDTFVRVINETVENGGNVVIPSFAVGRTQEVIYDMHKQREKYGVELEKILKIPVFVDSPLAISATEIFRKNLDCYDEEARAYIKNGDNPLDFPGLQFTRTSEESKALNFRKDSIVIISASGMCEAGRIKHHLKHNLWRKESTILFVGYQAEGTLGRKLVDGAKTVTIFGEEISVNARIVMLEGFSGHADRNGLLGWIENYTKKPEKIFAVHGEEGAIEEFAGLINGKFGIETVAPSRGSSYVIYPEGEAVKAAGTEIKADAVEDKKAAAEHKKDAITGRIVSLKNRLNNLADLLNTGLEEEKSATDLDMLEAELAVLERCIKG